MNNSLYGNFRTRKFTDIWPQFETFKADYDKNGVGQPLNDQSIQTLYYLLYARYGNSHILSSDENQFKYKVWNTIFMYGPTWEKRLDIQTKLRALSEEDLLTGAQQIYNHSWDPGTAPSTLDTEELDTVNEQKVSKYSRSKLDAYQFLYDLLKVDVSKSFLDRFAPLFNPFGAKQFPLWYEEL